MIEIDVPTLRLVSCLLLDRLEAQGGTSISLDKDFYWQIAEVDRYKIEDEPNEFEVGQLSEDWENIRRIAEGTADPLAFDLCWLASILSAIGEKVVR